MIQYLSRRSSVCVMTALSDNLRAKGIEVDSVDWLIFFLIKLLFQRPNEPTRITLIPLIVTLISRRHGFEPLITVSYPKKEFYLLATNGGEGWLVRRNWRKVIQMKKGQPWYPVEQIYCLGGHASYTNGNTLENLQKVSMTIFLKER